MTHQSSHARKTQLKADLMLLLITFFWGVSYYLVAISLAEVEPFTMNAIRFLLAFFIAVIFFWRKLRRISRETIRYAALLGLILTAVYFGATYGLRYTSISNAGFLCALVVVFTPVLGFFFKQQRPSAKLGLVVVMAMAGIALLTLNDQLRPASGDLLCIFSALVYASHLLVTETAVRREQVDSFQLGVLQLGFAGVIQLVLAYVTETPRLPQTAEIWGAVLFLAIFCTGIPFVVQTIAQQYTTASHTGVIFTMEPVFAGVIAYLVAGEVLRGRAYVGAVILLASLFVLEIDFKKLAGGIRPRSGGNLAPQLFKQSADRRQEEDDQAEYGFGSNIGDVIIQRPGDDIEALRRILPEEDDAGQKDADEAAEHTDQVAELKAEPPVLPGQAGQS
ncbi:MAG TPA: DMT family transporter [Clostridiales bacterium]|nr:DMT family transporter [Clostridiales bacterium]